MVALFCGCWVIVGVYVHTFLGSVKCELLWSFSKMFRDISGCLTAIANKIILVSRLLPSWNIAGDTGCGHKMLRHWC